MKYFWLSRGQERILAVEIEGATYRTDCPGDIIEIKIEKEGWAIQNTYIMSDPPWSVDGVSLSSGTQPMTRERRMEIFREMIKVLDRGVMFLEAMDRDDRLVSLPLADFFWMYGPNVDVVLARFNGVLAAVKTSTSRPWDEDMLLSHVEFIMFVWLKGVLGARADHLIPGKITTFNNWFPSAEKACRKRGLILPHETVEQILGESP